MLLGNYESHFTPNPGHRCVVSILFVVMGSTPYTFEGLQSCAETVFVGRAVAQTDREVSKVTTYPLGLSSRTD